MILTHGSLFSGIGGFDLAAEWMGWENVFHCEKNGFGRKILNYYWPQSISYHDIKETDFTKHSGQIDVLTGGFPCQPYSNAGKRKGKNDERHLWPEMLRAISEITPRWIVGENVRGIINWDGGVVFEEVQSDLENEGYNVQSFLLPACGVNAPHQRYRVWIIAHSKNVHDRVYFREQEEGQKQELREGAIRNVATNPSGIRLQRRASRSQTKERAKSADKQSQGCNKLPGQEWEMFPSESPVFRRDDGISKRLDGISLHKWHEESCRGYGNAVVPQLVLQIFKAIEEFEILINQ